MSSSSSKTYNDIPSFHRYDFPLYSRHSSSPYIPSPLTHTLAPSCTSGYTPGFRQHHSKTHLGQCTAGSSPASSISCSNLLISSECLRLCGEIVSAKDSYSEGCEKGVRKGKVGGRGVGIFRWQMKRFWSVGILQVGILYFWVRVYKIWRGEEDCVHEFCGRKSWNRDVMQWL
jgi:hypothetical protein